MNKKWKQEHTKRILVSKQETRPATRQRIPPAAGGLEFFIKEVNKTWPLKSPAPIPINISIQDAQPIYIATGMQQTIKTFVKTTYLFSKPGCFTHFEKTDCHNKTINIQPSKERIWRYLSSFIEDTRPKDVLNTRPLIQRPCVAEAE
ncbi:MAG: hypothetical protein WDO19_26080 [Bacteroidota bacterium]